MQELFSLGDRHIFPVIEKMVENGRLAYGLFPNVGIDPDFYIFRQKPFEEALPWDFMDIGIPKEKLWALYGKAVEIT